MIWAGAQPAPGQFNETYFSEVASLVEKLGQAGIYAILDVHQDLLSRYFCGEGLMSHFFFFFEKNPSLSSWLTRRRQALRTGPS